MKHALTGIDFSLVGDVIARESSTEAICIMRLLRNSEAEFLAMSNSELLL